MQQIAYPEMRATGRYRRQQVRCRRTGPCDGQAPQATRIIVKVNPFLTPGIAPLDQDELPTEEGMEGMRYTKQFLPINCITCSWLLI
ncbi:MAG: hypothetical protein Q7R45_06075 [Sulfuricaulis sp.]|nr:hypothetical protein [Sulfuricaulis sp.]